MVIPYDNVPLNLQLTVQWTFIIQLYTVHKGGRFVGVLATCLMAEIL